MTRSIFRGSWLILCLALIASLSVGIACDSDSGGGGVQGNDDDDDGGDDDDDDGGGIDGVDFTWVIEPGPDATQEALTAFTNVRPGEGIYFAEGNFEINSTLVLEEAGVIISGAGKNKTVLDFSNQVDTGNGHNGIMTHSDDTIIQNLQILDTVGDSIKTHTGTNIIIRNVHVEWTRGPDSENGPYAIYPVLSSNVLVEDSFVSGASDSGIYVGQSDGVVVRRNIAEYNVTGIEIENTYNSDVYDNVIRHNTGGILVFDMPGLPITGGNSTRVFNNEIYENNTPNFAPEGNVVGIVPGGTGLFIFANDIVEAFGNSFRDNQSFNVLIGSWNTISMFSESPPDDPNPGWDADPNTIYIHDNTFEGGGNDPIDEIGLTLKAFLPPGDRVPDVLWDGNFEEDKYDEDGNVLESERICMQNNTRIDESEVTAVNVNTPALLGSGVPDLTFGLEQFNCEHPNLPKVTWPGLTD